MSERTWAEILAEAWSDDLVLDPNEEAAVCRWIAEMPNSPWWQGAVLAAELVPNWDERWTPKP